jgi:hypothetical protein
MQKANSVKAACIYHEIDKMPYLQYPFFIDAGPGYQ